MSEFIPIEEARKQRKGPYHNHNVPYTPEFDGVHFDPAGYDPRPLKFGVSVGELSFQEPKPIEWWLSGYIIYGAVGALYAPGGTGKSYIQLQLAVCSALGISFCGVPVKEGRTLIASCEDDINIVNIRLRAIVKNYGREMSEIGDKIMIYDMSEMDASMIYADRDYKVKTKALWHDFLATCSEYEPDMVILDGLANIFDGNENVRSIAYGCVTVLKQIPASTGAAVLVSMHPSQFGQQTGSGTSGNTAWNGAFRYRLLLDYRDDDNQQERELKSMKQNYGANNSKIILKWDDENAVFRDNSPETNTVAKIEQNNLLNKMVITVEDLFNEGVGLHPSSPQSPQYFARVIMDHRHWDGCSKRYIEDIVKQCKNKELLKHGTARDEKAREKRVLIPFKWPNGLDIPSNA